MDRILKSSSGKIPDEHFIEIDVDKLLSKYGPEGLYDIALILTTAADEDVSDAMSSKYY